MSHSRATRAKPRLGRRDDFPDSPTIDVVSSSKDERPPADIRSPPAPMEKKQRRYQAGVARIFMKSLDLLKISGSRGPESERPSSAKTPPAHDKIITDSKFKTKSDSVARKQTTQDDAGVHPTEPLWNTSLPRPIKPSEVELQEVELNNCQKKPTSPEGKTSIARSSETSIARSSETSTPVPRPKHRRKSRGQRGNWKSSRRKQMSRSSESSETSTTCSSTPDSHVTELKKPASVKTLSQNRIIINPKSDNVFKDQLQEDCAMVVQQPTELLWNTPEPTQQSEVELRTAELQKLQLDKKSPENLASTAGQRPKPSRKFTTLRRRKSHRRKQMSNRSSESSEASTSSTSSTQGSQLSMGRSQQGQGRGGGRTKPPITAHRNTGPKPCRSQRNCRSYSESNGHPGSLNSSRQRSCPEGSSSTTANKGRLSTATENHSSTATKNLSSTATEDRSSTATKNLSSTATCTKNHSSTATKNHSSTATECRSSTATKNHSSTATKNHSSTATKNHSSTATKNHSSTATECRSSTATKNLSSSSTATRNHSLSATVGHYSTATEGRSSGTKEHSSTTVQYWDDDVWEAFSPIGPDDLQNEPQSQPNNWSPEASWQHVREEDAPETCQPVRLEEPAQKDDQDCCGHLNRTLEEEEVDQLVGDLSVDAREEDDSIWLEDLSLGVSNPTPGDSPKPVSTSAPDIPFSPMLYLPPPPPCEDESFEPINSQTETDFIPQETPTPSPRYVPDVKNSSHCRTASHVTDSSFTHQEELWPLEEMPEIGQVTTPACPQPEDNGCDPQNEVLPADDDSSLSSASVSLNREHPYQRRFPGPAPPPPGFYARPRPPGMFPCGPGPSPGPHGDMYMGWPRPGSPCSPSSPRMRQALLDYRPPPPPPGEQLSSLDWRQPPSPLLTPSPRNWMPPPPSGSSSPNAKRRIDTDPWMWQDSRYVKKEKTLTEDSKEFTQKVIKMEPPVLSSGHCSDSVSRMPLEVDSDRDSMAVSPTVRHFKRRNGSEYSSTPPEGATGLARDCHYSAPPIQYGLPQKSESPEFESKPAAASCSIDRPAHPMGIAQAVHPRSLGRGYTMATASHETSRTPTPPPDPPRRLSGDAMKKEVLDLPISPYNGPPSPAKVEQVATTSGYKFQYLPALVNTCTGRTILLSDTTDCPGAVLQTQSMKQRARTLIKQMGVEDTFLSQESGDRRVFRDEDILAEIEGDSADGGQKCASIPVSERPMMTVMPSLRSGSSEGLSPTGGALGRIVSSYQDSPDRADHDVDERPSSAGSGISGTLAEASPSPRNTVAPSRNVRGERYVPPPLRGRSGEAAREAASRYYTYPTRHNETVARCESVESTAGFKTARLPWSASTFNESPDETVFTKPEVLQKGQPRKRLSLGSADIVSMLGPSDPSSAESSPMVSPDRRVIHSTKLKLAIQATETKMPQLEPAVDNNNNNNDASGSTPEGAGRTPKEEGEITDDGEIDWFDGVPANWKPNKVGKFKNSKPAKQPPEVDTPAGVSDESGFHFTAQGRGWSLYASLKGIGRGATPTTKPPVSRGRIVLPPTSSSSDGPVGASRRSGSYGGAYDLSQPPPPPPPSLFELPPRLVRLQQSIRRNTSLAMMRSPAERMAGVKWMNTKEKFQLCYKNVSVPYIDTHCHLDFLFERSGYRGSFQKYRLLNEETFPECFAGCVAVFCNPKSFRSEGLWKDVLQEDNVWGAVGCHPKCATDFGAFAQQNMRQMIQHPKVLAVGEIGLDYSGSFHYKQDVQKRVFEAQLKMALEISKPVVIHCRDAESDCLQLMEKMLPRDYKIHRHCWTGPWDSCQTWLETFPGSYIGLTPLVTNRSQRAQVLREVMLRVPLNRLLLETDAPYFVPNQISQDEMQYSHPGMAISVAREVANLRCIPIEDVLNACLVNSVNMYGMQL